MKKPVLAIDIDDVLTASNEGVRRYVNRTFGMNHTPADYAVTGEYRRYWDRIWSADEEEGRKIYESYLASGETARLKPVDGALPAIRRLQTNYALVVVTARHIEQVEHTKDWLGRHAPNIFKRVEFLLERPDNENITKAYILRELGAEYIIDDNADHCRHALDAGIQALLFGEYGWNREVTVPDGIVRVKNWSEVLEYLDA